MSLTSINRFSRYHCQGQGLYLNENSGHSLVAILQYSNGKLLQNMWQVHKPEYLHFVVNCHDTPAVNVALEKKVKNICDANTTTFFHLVWFSTPEEESQGTLLQWEYILFNTERGAHFGHKYLHVVTWVGETMCQEKNSGLVLTSKTLHLRQPHHPESEEAINFLQKRLYHKSWCIKVAGQ